VKFRIFRPRRDTVRIDRVFLRLSHAKIDNIEVCSVFTVNHFHSYNYLSFRVLQKNVSFVSSNAAKGCMLLRLVAF